MDLEESNRSSKAAREISDQMGDLAIDITDVALCSQIKTKRLSETPALEEGNLLPLPSLAGLRVIIPMDFMPLRATGYGKFRMIFAGVSSFLGDQIEARKSLA